MKTKDEIGMKVSDMLTVVIVFFNDLIAHILPGIIFILAVSHFILSTEDVLNWHWSILIGISFTVGHFLLALEFSLDKLIQLIRKKFLKPASNKADENKKTWRTAIQAEFVKYYLLYAKYTKNSQTIELNKNLPDRAFRSIAMSLSEEATNVGRRFTFIALFCKAVMMTIILTVPFFVVEFMMQFRGESEWFLLWSVSVSVAVSTILAHPLNQRAEQFYEMSLSTPITIGLAEIIKGVNK